MLAYNHRPATFEDAVTWVLAHFGDLERFRDEPFDSLIGYHHTTGRFFRNHFGMWDGNTALVADCCRARGVPADCDGASQAIVEEVWRRLQIGRVSMAFDLVPNGAHPRWPTVPDQKYLDLYQKVPGIKPGDVKARALAATRADALAVGRANNGTTSGNLSWMDAIRAVRAVVRAEGRWPWIWTEPTDERLEHGPTRVEFTFHVGPDYVYAKPSFPEDAGAPSAAEPAP